MRNTFVVVPARADVAACQISLKRPFVRRVRVDLWPLTQVRTEYNLCELFELWWVFPEPALHFPPALQLLAALHSNQHLYGRSYVRISPRMTTI